MNDFDTEFRALEEVELTDNPGNVSVLTLKANVHCFDQWTTHTKELETNKKRKKTEESTPLAWKRNVSPHSREYCLLEGKVANQNDESVSASDIINKLLILMFWLIYLFNKATSIVSHRCIRDKSYHWRQLHHDCKTVAKHTSFLGLQSF